ncbi:MAG: nickel-dependent hydrogenase large subunit [Pseudomonadota bacterium]
MQKIVIDPLSRIEGHLKVEALVDSGVVKEATVSGTLFRGFEIFLKGRDPWDAVRITERVCGVCPAVHGTASAQNLDSALGVTSLVPHNARLIRNLILGANFIQSHILHFYALAALDFVDVTAVADYAGNDPNLQAVKTFIDRGALAPFVPRYEGDYRLTKEQNVELTGHYVQALRMRAIAHEALALFGGKMPHDVGMVPGGVVCAPTVDKIMAMVTKLREISEFTANVYLPDILAVAGAYPDYFEIGKGVGNYLAWGAFDEDLHADLTQRHRYFPNGAVINGVVGKADPNDVFEHVKHSWFEDECAAQPAQGNTVPAPGKEGAYSWLKSPRFKGKAVEVGPLARTMVAYLSGNSGCKAEVDALLSVLDATPAALQSVLGRHAARAIETKRLTGMMTEWALALKPGEPICVEAKVPASGSGFGCVDGPRGALGHWIEIEDKRISRYQLVVPTTWNASPKDADGVPGPIEQALIGTAVKDAENPFELGRIVRSFDPCLACAVHVLDAQRNLKGVIRIA